MENTYVNEFTVSCRPVKGLEDKDIIKILSNNAQIEIIKWFRDTSGPLKIRVRTEDASSFENRIKSVSIQVHDENTKKDIMINPVIRGRLLVRHDIVKV